MFKGESLKAATLRALQNCSKDMDLPRCFLSGDDEMAFQEGPGLNVNIDSEDQYYNNKKIIDRMGAGKDEMPPAASEKGGSGGALPFLSSSSQAERISRFGECRRMPTRSRLKIWRILNRSKVKRVTSEMFCLFEAVGTSAVLAQ